MVNKQFCLGILVLVFGVINSCSTTTPTTKLLRLEEELDNQMRMRAIELAQARYKNTDFDKINRIDSTSKTNADIRLITNTYKVFVRGNILGIMSYEVDVIVAGEINIRTNNVRVLEAKFR